VSEYQYYEFQTIDRRLTAEEMRDLRRISTRARITPTSFVNEYEWGSFKGDATAWMDRQFDAFLYFANWGSREFELSLPARLLDWQIASRYCCGGSASVRERNGKTIFHFDTGDDEPDDDWEDQSDALAAMIPIRSQLARGDLRALYIGWLRGAQSGDFEESDNEPPVPSGLGELDGSLERLVDFLRIDTDLLEVAAANSRPLFAQSLSPEAVRRWLSERSPAEKDVYLERVIAEDPAVAIELQRLIADGDDVPAETAPRTVGSLLRAAEAATDRRRRVEMAQVEKDRKRRKEAALLARTAYLENLALHERAAWMKIERFLSTRQPANYDQAVLLLVDLREVATTTGRETEFRQQLETLCVAHHRKPSLLAKLQRAGLQLRS
jgi:hypothetical protein